MTFFNMKNMPRNVCGQFHLISQDLLVMVPERRI